MNENSRSDAAHHLVIALHLGRATSRLIRSLRTAERDTDLDIAAARDEAASVLTEIQNGDGALLPGGQPIIERAREHVGASGLSILIDNLRHSDDPRPYVIDAVKLLGSLQAWANQRASTAIECEPIEGMVRLA